MNADTASKTTAAIPPVQPLPQPDDLLAEGARVRELSRSVEGVKTIIDGDDCSGPRCCWPPARWSISCSRAGPR